MRTVKTDQTGRINRADSQADLSLRWAHTHFVGFLMLRLIWVKLHVGYKNAETALHGPRQANLILIAYESSEGSGEPAHPRSLARTFAARSYKQWIKRNLQTESQIPGPSEWLGMRSWNLSWRNARRHKFAWRGSHVTYKYKIGDNALWLTSQNHINSNYTRPPRLLSSGEKPG